MQISTAANTSCEMQNSSSVGAYAAPQLISYGSISALTASGSGVGTENMAAMGMCANNMGAMC